MTSHHCILPARMATLNWSLFFSTKELISTQQPRFVFIFLFMEMPQNSCSANLWHLHTSSKKRQKKNTQQRTKEKKKKEKNAQKETQITDIHFPEWLHAIVYCLPQWPPWSGHSSPQQRIWSQLSKQGLFLSLVHFDKREKRKTRRKSTFPTISIFITSNHWHFLSSLALRHFMLPVRRAILKWSLFSSIKELMSTQQARFLLLFLFPLGKKRQREQRERDKNTERWK